MRRLWRRASVLTLSAFAVGAFLPGAAAQAGGSGCPGFYCLWTKKNFEGKRFVGDTKRLVNLPDYIDDKASSMKWDLPEGKRLHVYERKNGGGSAGGFCAKGNIAAFAGENNSYSSADIITGPC